MLQGNGEGNESYETNAETLEYVTWYAKTATMR